MSAKAKKKGRVEQSLQKGLQERLQKHFDIVAYWVYLHRIAVLIFISVISLIFLLWASVYMARPGDFLFFPKVFLEANAPGLLFNKDKFSDRFNSYLFVASANDCTKLVLAEGELKKVLRELTAQEQESSTWARIASRVRSSSLETQCVSAIENKQLLAITLSLALNSQGDNSLARKVAGEWFGELRAKYDSTPEEGFSSEDVHILIAKDIEQVAVALDTLDFSINPALNLYEIENAFNATAAQGWEKLFYTWCSFKQGIDFCEVQESEAAWNSVNLSETSELERVVMSRLLFEEVFSQLPQ